MLQETEMRYEVGNRDQWKGRFRGTFSRPWQPGDVPSLCRQELGSLFSRDRACTVRGRPSPPRQLPRSQGPGSQEIRGSSLEQRKDPSLKDLETRIWRAPPRTSQVPGQPTSGKPTSTKRHPCLELPTGFSG